MKGSIYTRSTLGCGVALLMACALPSSAAAGLFDHSRPTASAAPSPYIGPIQRALDEQRLLDASKMIAQAALSGDKDPRLSICAGQLNLARGQYQEALNSFRRVENAPGVQGDSLEGQGLALSLLEQSDEALAVLQKAVAAKPSAWRAWNALGREYDARRKWPDAEAAYEHAMTESNRAPIVLNNRGFSRMLQGRMDDAVRDFVEALSKKPDLAAARTNLRLAMASRGEYDRAVANSPQDAEAATLNNTGFAAMLRGDYDAAEALFDRAMQAKGEYYARAATNLQLARSLKAQSATASKEPARAR